MSIYYYRTPYSEQPFYNLEELVDYNSGLFGEKFSLEPHLWYSLQERVAMLLAERLNDVQEEDLKAKCYGMSFSKSAASHWF